MFVLRVGPAPAVVGSPTHLFEDRCGRRGVNGSGAQPHQGDFLLLTVVGRKRAGRERQRLLLLLRHSFGVVGFVFEGGCGFVDGPLGGAAMGGRGERADVLVKRVLERCG